MAFIIFCIGSNAWVIFFLRFFILFFTYGVFFFRVVNRQCFNFWPWSDEWDMYIFFYTWNNESCVGNIFTLLHME